MKNMEIVNIDDNDQVSTVLLTLVSKLSLTDTHEALKILAMCAKDDIPRVSVLNYTLELIIKSNNYISN